MPIHRADVENNFKSDADSSEICLIFSVCTVCHVALKRGCTGSSLEKSSTVLLVDYFKAEAALSKFGSSEELIDLAAKDLVCLPLGEVSDDGALAFYPLRVAANLRQRD